MSSTSLPKTDPDFVRPSGKVPGRKRPKRWMVGSAIAALVLVGAVIAYLLLTMNQLAPLLLPKLPTNLSASQIGLAQWQEYQQPLPAHPLSNPLLPTTPQTTLSLALLEDAAGQAIIQQGNLTRGLAYLQAATLADPDNLRLSNDYRLALRNHELYSEEQTFFVALAQKEQTVNVNIEYALSYVDLMRSCPKPPDGLVCQAQDSYNSIALLNKILQQEPYNILAHYARGLNDLYWPSLMRHLPQAQQDLQYALALSRFQQKIGPAFVPQAYIALGDAFGKAGDTTTAHQVWLNGRKVVEPQAQALLQQRLAIPQDQLVAQENQQLRGLGVYVDTDLSIFWRKG
jgi:hypothetical protein